MQKGANMPEKIEEKAEAAEVNTRETRSFMQQVKSSIQTEVHP